MHRMVWTVVCVSSCLLTGCVIANGPSASMTLQSGRTISVESDRPFRTLRGEALSHEAATAVIGRQQFLVEPDEIYLDGAAVASIPAATRNVTVAERSARLVVTADGRTVYDDEF